MVKCEVSGVRLDLEFIVTGGAQFKVSAAALGLNTANVSTLPSASNMTSSSMGRQSGRLDEEYEGLDAAAAADVLLGDAAEAALGTRSGSGGQASAQDRQQEHMSPRSSTSSPAMLSIRPAQAETAGANDQGGRQGAPAASAASSSGDMDLQDQPSPGGSGPAALLDDGAYCANSSYDMSGAPAATALGSRTLARIINRYSSYSSSGALPAGSPPFANGMSLSAAAGVAGKSFVRGLGSRALGAADEGARSSCRPVKTDDGEYLVWVESFSLTFRCAGLWDCAGPLGTDAGRMARSGDTAGGAAGCVPLQRLAWQPCDSVNVQTTAHGCILVQWTRHNMQAVRVLTCCVGVPAATRHLLRWLLSY
jgi:hypothetical protein